MGHDPSKPSRNQGTRIGRPVDYFRESRFGLPIITSENVHMSALLILLQDMAMFAQNAHKGTESCLGLISLTSLTLTIHPSTITPAFTEGVLALLASSPLLHFQIYASSSTRAPTSMVTTASYIATPSHSSASFQAQSTKQRQEDEDKARRQALIDDFCRRIVGNHGTTLKRFSFHRIRLSLSVVEEVCRKCAGLEQLFMLIMPEELVRCVGPLLVLPKFLIPWLRPEQPYLGQILAHATNMKTVHINFTHRPATYNPREGTQMLVEQCSSSITQFGIETRVWHVSLSFFDTLLLTSANDLVDDRSRERW